MVNIKVAVRIRPFSQRESTRKDETVARKEDKAVVVTDPRVPERRDGGDGRRRTRKFVVDYCYDPEDPAETCGQEAVYREIGLEVLDSAFEGYNACVLAYGHSASGKTYTMMGPRDDPGLTPRICRGLFRRLDERESAVETIRNRIVVSFLEIYNEKVRDLLSDDEAGSSSGNFSLRVREHPKSGPYVQDLSEHSVTDEEKILELLSAGNRRRSTAATENNVRSSRSHAVFTLSFEQTDERNHEIEKSSKVHLVDLAGSERASSSQSKTRLKEGANINKSLVTLGNVISALAESHEASGSGKERSGSKTCQPFVPYRDSVLTWLLKDTLGGNSNTIMIATVSPASSCLSETVNTLRYAKRTKKIINRPIVNEDPKIKIIRELREEIFELKSLLGFFRSRRKSFESVENFFNFNENIFEEFSNRGNSSFAEWQNHPGRTLPADVRAELGAKEKASEAEPEIPGRGNESSEEKEPDSEKFESDATDEGDSRTIRKSRSSLAFGKISGAPSSGGDACEINDEKKSDVNGSVIDDLPCETQIFSDSLESFSSFSSKARNFSEAGSGETERRNAVDDDEGRSNAGQNIDRISKGNGPESRKSSEKKFSDCSKREFGSCENLTEAGRTIMSHGNGPDLIKGISGRSKDGHPSASSQSCTDASNLSQSTSENSLNSSGGSVEAQPPENLRFPRGGFQKASPSGTPTETKGKSDGDPSPRKSEGNERFQTVRKKKDKRSEIVEAVTTRLYLTEKKPPDRRMEAQRQAASEKDDFVEGDGELEELKLCKRARMKLFDLSRKLAVTRRTKRTADNGTQTDFLGSTVRLKEKSVLTDRSGVPDVKNSATNTTEEPFGKTEAYVIMNQAFVPRSFRTAETEAECGKRLKIEIPELPVKQNLSTQTESDEKTFNDASTSPVKSVPGSDECFSDDSLDLEDNWKQEKSRDFQSEESFDSGSQILTRNHRYFPSFRDSSSGSEAAISDKTNEFLLMRSNLSSNSTGSAAGNPNATKEARAPLFDGGLPLTEIFSESLSGGGRVGNESELVDSSSPNNFSPGYRKEEHFSSENSPGSMESSEAASFSETVSSEDFAYYESSREKEGKQNGIRAKDSGDRELYTITENGEQSDPSEAFGPDPSRGSSESKATVGGNPSQREAVKARNPEETERDFAWKGSAGSFDFLDEKSRDYDVPNSDLESEEGFLEDAEKVPNLDNGGNYKNPLKYENDSVSPKSRKVNWVDLKVGGSYSEKQYVNFNISNSSKSRSPFSIDTHLFEESSKRDRSTEVTSASQDSITFVFMGPAKPKTSVLMEIIKRSLERPHHPSGELRKSRSGGVRCDPKPMTRSVSVDTAMIALSRIAKNQRPGRGVAGTASLDALAGDDVPRPVSERGRLENGRCGFAARRREPVAKSTENFVLKYSVATSTTRDEQTETTKDEIERMGEPRRECENSREENLVSGGEKSEAAKPEEGSMETSPRFDIGCSETEAEEPKGGNDCISKASSDSSSQTRRVRFSKPETRSLHADERRIIDRRKEEAVRSAENMSAFLKEATRLLKTLNYVSVNCEMSREMEEIVKRPEEIQNSQKKENEVKSSFGKSLKKSEVSVQTEIESSSSESGRFDLRSRASIPITETQNLTWPGRRSTTGKPPTGIRYDASPKSCRYRLSSRLNSPCFDGTFDSNRNRLQSIRPADRNASNLSTAFGDSFVGEGGRSSIPSSSRSLHSDGNEGRNGSCRPPSRRPSLGSTNVPKVNLDSVLELEAQLEESCRRLESAVERDRLRQEISASKKGKTSSFTYVFENDSTSADSFESDSELLSETEKPKLNKDLVRRRNDSECLQGCLCKSREKRGGGNGGGRCRSCLASNVYCSAFELDSYGPGSNHCSQFCMFCGKNDSEIYFSAPSLNSECESPRCRLKYYGYCPCASVRLRRVGSSPRAYMQHLLALRRHIVNATERGETT